MDVRHVVGGALTRNAVLCQLLWNYACVLDQGGSSSWPRSAACFIVPDWSADRPSPAPSGSRVLTIHVHTSRTDPGRDEALDAVLQLLHAVLTDERTCPSITARRVPTPAGLVVSHPGTVVRSGSWDIAPVGSRGPAAAPRRLLPWPACLTSGLTIGAVAAGTPSLN